MTEHVHFPDCKHLHQHKADCNHGTPTAKPRSGVCPTCLAFTADWAYCNAHFRWECPRHPRIQVHHGLEKQS